MSQSGFRWSEASNAAHVTMYQNRPEHRVPAIKSITVQLRQQQCCGHLLTSQQKDSEFPVERSLPDLQPSARSCEFGANENVLEISMLSGAIEMSPRICLWCWRFCETGSCRDKLRLRQCMTVLGSEMLCSEACLLVRCLGVA